MARRVARPVGPEALDHVFHFNPDAVDGQIRFVQHATSRLWRHVDHEAAFAVPGTKRRNDIAVGRQPFTVWRDVHDGGLIWSRTNTDGQRWWWTGSSSLGGKITLRTRTFSFSKSTLWCLGAATTASSFGSQVAGFDGSTAFDIGASLMMDWPFKSGFRRRRRYFHFMSCRSRFAIRRQARQKARRHCKAALARKSIRAASGNAGYAFPNVTNSKYVHRDSFSPRPDEMLRACRSGQPTSNCSALTWLNMPVPSSVAITLGSIA